MKKIFKFICVFVAFVVTCTFLYTPRAEAASMPFDVDLVWSFDGKSSLSIFPEEIPDGGYTIKDFVEDNLADAAVAYTDGGKYLLKTDSDEYFLLEGFTDATGENDTVLYSGSEYYSLSLTDYIETEPQIYADGVELSLSDLESLKFYASCPLDFTSEADYENTYNDAVYDSVSNKIYVPNIEDGYLLAKYSGNWIYLSKSITEEQYLYANVYSFNIFCGEDISIVLNGYNTESAGYYPYGTHITARITPESGKDVVIYNSLFNFDVTYDDDTAVVTYDLYQSDDIRCITTTKEEDKTKVYFYVGENLLEVYTIDSNATFNVSDYDYLLTDDETYYEYFMFDLSSGWDTPTIIDGHPIVVHLYNSEERRYALYNIEYVDKNGKVSNPTEGHFDINELVSGNYYAMPGTDPYYDSRLGCFISKNIRDYYEVFLDIHSLVIDGVNVEMEANLKWPINPHLQTVKVYEVAVDEPKAITPIAGIGYGGYAVTEIQFSVNKGWIVNPDGDYELNDGVYTFKDVDVSNGYILALNAEAAPITIEFYTEDPEYYTSAVHLTALDISAHVGDALELPAVHNEYEATHYRVPVWWRSNNPDYDKENPTAVYSEDGKLVLYPYTIETSGGEIFVSAYKNDTELDDSSFSFKFSLSSYELKEVNGGYITNKGNGDYYLEYAADLDLYLFISIDGSEYFNMYFNEQTMFEYYYVGTLTSDNMSVEGNGWYTSGRDVSIDITPDPGYKIQLLGTEYDKKLLMNFDDIGTLHCYFKDIAKSYELNFGASVDDGTYSLYLIVDGHVYKEVEIESGVTELAEINAILSSDEFILEHPGYSQSAWDINDGSLIGGKFFNLNHNVLGYASNKSDYVMFSFNAYNVFGTNILEGDLEKLDIYDVVTDNLLDVEIRRIGKKYYFLLPSSVDDVYADIGDEILGHTLYGTSHLLEKNSPSESLSIYSIKIDDDAMQYVEEVTGEGFYAWGQEYNLKFKEKEGYENFVYKVGYNVVTPRTEGEYRIYPQNNGSVELLITADAMDVNVKFYLGGVDGTLGLEVTYKTGDVIEIPSYEDIVGLPLDKMLGDWLFASGPVLVENTKCEYDADAILIYNNLVDCNYFAFSARIESDDSYSITGTDQVKISSSSSSIVDAEYICNYSSSMGMYLIKHRSDDPIYLFLDYKDDGNFVYFESINTANMSMMDYNLVEINTQELPHVSCDTQKFYILGDNATFIYTVEKGYTLLINDEDLTLEQIDETIYTIETLVSGYKEIIYSVDYQTYSLTFLLEEDGVEITEYISFYKYMENVELPTSLPYSYEAMQDTKLFLGWNRELKTMPNSDTVLYATYSEVLSSYISISFENSFTKTFITPEDFKISSSATELIDITKTVIIAEGMTEYLVKYPSTTPSLWIRMPGDTDYKYVDKELKDEVSLEYLYVEIEDNENYSTNGNGFYLLNSRIELSIAPNTGYSVEAQGGYVIYNGIISVEVTAPISVEISVTQNNYYILYYVNNEYYDIQDNLHYMDEITMLVYEKKGYAFSGWDRQIEVMPAENIVVYGTSTARIELSITLDYNDSTLVDANSLFLSNSYEAGGSVVKGVLNDNTITFGYTGKMYLWLYDSYLGAYKYIDAPMEGEINLSLYLVSASSSTHYHLDGLGYYPAGSNVKITPVADDGYYLVYNGEKVTGDIIIPNISKNESIVCDVNKETYKIYYYVSGNLYHEDSYEYDADVVMAEYEWDGSDYEKWNQLIFKMPAFNINIYAVERANAFLYEMPIVTVHKLSTLAEATIEGGIVFIGDNIEDGTFKFKEADEIITAEGSYKISFIPSNPIYKEYIFDVNVLLCNPIYSEELIEPEILNVSVDSIRMSINAHYEYSVDGGDYYKGGIVNITGLKDNTSYRIEYRYMDDSNYCHSKSKSIIVKTLSADEELYNDCVSEGNEMLSLYERLIDNEIIQRYLAIYKAELRKGYDTTASYFGAKLAEKLEYIESILKLTYNIELKRNESLLNTARIDLFTENRLNEIIDLAFENNTPVNNIKSFSEYVIGVFDSSNTLIKDFDLNLNSRARIATTEDKTYVTDKIDELLDYNYDSYTLIDLDDYVTGYVTSTAVMISNAYESIHMCDGEEVVLNVSSKVNAISGKTYIDYSFNRSEYDKAFFEAAEAAIISHVQGIVLESLTQKYNLLVDSSNDTKRINKYTKNYEREYEKYSSYDSFKASYEEILEGKDESFTYEDLLNTYDATLDNALALKNSAHVSDVEVLIIFITVVAILGCGVAAIIIRRRHDAK